MGRRPRIWLGLVGLSALGACQTTLREDLGEAEAVQIALALDSAGIASSRVRGRSGDGTPSYAIQVAGGDVTAALRALERAEVPHQEPKGFDSLLSEPGLLMTPHEERARWAAATAGELARSLRGWPGVLDARVHLAIADAPAALDQPRAPAKAAVLLRLEALAAPIAEAQVRALVAGAVDGLEAERVSVVQVHAEAAPLAPARLVRIGPVEVTSRSAPALRALLAFALLLDLALAGLLVVLVRRRRSARGRLFPGQPASSSAGAGGAGSPD